MCSFVRCTRTLFDTLDCAHCRVLNGLIHGSRACIRIRSYRFQPNNPASYCILVALSIGKRIEWKRTQLANKIHPTCTDEMRTRNHTGCRRDRPNTFQHRAVMPTRVTNTSVFNVLATKMRRRHHGCQPVACHRNRARVSITSHRVSRMYIAVHLVRNRVPQYTTTAQHGPDQRMHSYRLERIHRFVRCIWVTCACICISSNDRGDRMSHVRCSPRVSDGHPDIWW